MLKTTAKILHPLALGLALALSPLVAGPGYGQMKSVEMKGMDHQGMTDHKAMGKKAAPMTHGAPMGDKVHEATVDGHRFAYHVMDNQEAMAKMKDMPGMAAHGHGAAQMKSHHLMLYLTGPDGKPLTDAKLGYLVKGPDGKEQKTMTMAMEGGFGADVDFAAKGKYQIKTKAVAGGKTLVDEFSYEVK